MSEPKSNHRGRPLRRARAIAAAALLGLALTACGDDERPAYVEKPVEELYNGALDAMQVGDYEEAARLFDEVERQHPYSEWASKAQLMAAYAFYQENSYDEAVNALDRFIELHPGSPDVVYAYYLKAICYYEQISDVRRDQKATSEALNALEELVRRFPDSKYSRDAQLKIDLALDHLAGKYMEIGRFYQGRSEYLAAINRFRTVIERYQTTTHVPEALHRLVECYLAMGIVDEAKATAAVLGHNFPGSEWYLDSYALLTGENLSPEDSGGSWISGIF
ncbi:MAG: outer membrane protein assembly factor BamD [Kiloniellaceae bacterium]